jgi:hypothetical protein
MADDEKTEAEVPAYFREFQAQVGQTVQQLAQSQQQLASAVQAQAEVRQPQQPAPILPNKEVDDRFLNEFVANPTQTFANFKQIVTDEASRQAGQMIEQREEQHRQEDAARQFEQEFFRHNQDLAPYRALVVDHLQRQPGNLDPSARANAAAEEVRQLLVQSQAQAVENDRRQRAEKLRAAGIRGSQLVSMGAEHLNPESEIEARMKRSKMLDDYKAQRMG